jgi:hypothetical protein
MAGADPPETPGFDSVMEAIPKEFHRPVDLALRKKIKGRLLRGAAARSLFGCLVRRR